MKTYRVPLLFASIFSLALFFVNTQAGETSGTLSIAMIQANYSNCIHYSKVRELNLDSERLILY